MTRWRFRRRSGDRYEESECHIDASPLRRSVLADQRPDEVESIALVVDGQPTPLGELFEVDVESTGEAESREPSAADDRSASDEIIVEGNLRRVHGLGTAHDLGTFRIQGDAGDCVAAGMTGGRLIVQGDCGDFLAAPLGAHRTGMSGGWVHVSGSAGTHAGHRMRRGTVVIDGSAGSMLAASMVAGTILVGNRVGDHLAVGMKRGTIVLAAADATPVPSFFSANDRMPSRFSKPQPHPAHFLKLMRSPECRRLVDSFAARPVMRSIADRTVGGLGEILYVAG